MTTPAIVPTIELNPQSFDLTPLFSSLKEKIEKYLPTSSTTLYILLDSSALISIVTTTLKNLPYIRFASTFGVNDLCHMLTSRVSFLESALISTACLIHNLVMAILFTILCAITFGLSQQCNYSLKKHWVHTGLSIASIGIAALGTLIPTLGAYGTLGLLSVGYECISYRFEGELEVFEPPLIDEIKGIYRKYLSTIENVVHDYVNDEPRYQREIRPGLKYFSDRLATIQTLRGLYDVIASTINTFPKVPKEENGENNQALLISPRKKLTLPKSTSFPKTHSALN